MTLDEIQRWLTPDEALGLNNCDREPIHIPGAIQPHGALCAVSDEGVMVMESQNLETFFGEGEFSRERLLGELLELEFEPTHRQVFERALCEMPCTLITHRIDGVRVFEFEPVQDHDATSLITAVNRLSQSIAQSENTNDVFELAVKDVRALTGFDRVLAYLFDPEGHGEVVAACTADGVESFLGLRFPSTDIPKQARRLYTLELTRQIACVDYHPVALVPERNPVTDRPLNMVYSQLRSVSPIHLQYLRNMGVHASFSISVVVHDELYAMIVCHHNEPRRLEFRERQTCEVIGRLLSQYCAAHEERKRREQRSVQLAAQVELLGELGEVASLTTDNPAWERARSFVEAESMIVCVGEDVSVYGVPLEQGVLEVGKQMFKRNSAEVSHTSCLSDYMGGVSGGVLVVPVGSQGWLGWFRQSEERLVTWAGRPPEDGEQKELTPRVSFQQWQDVIKGRCRDWKEQDLEMAEILRRGLTARFDEIPVQDSFERAMRQLREYVYYLEEHTHALNRVNSDLRQFAYAASHDLRAPLRTVRSFLPLIREGLDDSSDASLFEWLDYVENAADTLYRLQEGLWAFARVNRNTQCDDVDLAELFDRVIKGLAADLADAEVHVAADLPGLYGVSSQIEMLFRNLIDNACKYRNTSRRLRLSINAFRANGDWVIAVSDNGIGFPPAAAERIFELFTRVHTSHSDGDGLGLALCRRIAHHHNGWIRATSDPSQGSTFEVCLKRPSV